MPEWIWLILVLCGMAFGYFVGYGEGAKEERRRSQARLNEMSKRGIKP